MPATGYLNTSGFALPTMWFCAPVDVLSTGEKTPLAITLKKGDIINRVFVHVKTAEATAGTKTIDVGLNGTAPDDDPDGLLDGVSTAAAGVIRGSTVVTVGGTETFLASTTIGALLQDFLAGANVAGDVGTLVAKEHVITQSDAVLTYTLGSAHTELVADIYVEITRLPVLVA